MKSTLSDSVARAIEEIRMERTVGICEINNRELVYIERTDWLGPHKYYDAESCQLLFEGTTQEAINSGYISSPLELDCEFSLDISIDDEWSAGIEMGKLMRMQIPYLSEIIGALVDLWQDIDSKIGSINKNLRPPHFVIFYDDDGVLLIDNYTEIPEPIKERLVFKI